MDYALDIRFQRPGWPVAWLTGFIWVTLALVCSSPLIAETTPMTIVGVKLLRTKRGSAGQPLRIQLPEDCHECSVMHGPFYEGQNAHEVFFYLKVPVSRKEIANVKVSVGDLDVRAVIVEKSYLKFHRSGENINFNVPVTPRQRSSTLEVQTNLSWPGVTVRVEHAFEGRRDGKYATGKWPAIQRQAALNLEFGLRDAIRALGIDREVCDRGLGRIHMMGFDTNYPLGHEDFPPHAHIILRWPHFAGSQAPHLYLKENGLLGGDVMVSIDGMPQIKTTSFAQGTPVPAIDYLGETVYETVENLDGTLTLRRPTVGSCDLRPFKPTEQNFVSGVLMSCTNGRSSQIRATDDTDAGVIRVFVDSKPPEVYRYDPDTAVLLNSDPSLPTNQSSTCAGDNPAPKE